MDINSIELPAFTIAALYGKSLVEPEYQQTPASSIPEPVANEPVKASVVSGTDNLKWLGNNRKNILLLVRYPGIVHIPDPGLQFLSGILGACRLSLDDTALLNLESNPGTDYKKLTNRFQSRQVFLFGVDPASTGLPLSFPPYQLQAFSGVTYLFAHSLEELENDKLLKSKLWVSLKRLFNL